jgi:hypothetical protein
MTYYAREVPHPKSRTPPGHHPGAAGTGKMQKIEPTELL